MKKRSCVSPGALRVHHRRSQRCSECPFPAGMGPGDWGLQPKQEYIRKPMSPAIPAGVLEPLQSSLCPFPRQRGKKYFKPQKPGTSASASETPAVCARVHPGGKETSSWYLTSCKASRKTDLTCWQSYLKRTDKVLLKGWYYPVIHAKLPADWSLQFPGLGCNSASPCSAPPACTSVKWE